MINKIYLSNNLPILKSLPDKSIDLVYIDPPFNTKTTQARVNIETVQDDKGDRVGFGGKKYRTIKVSKTSYLDIYDDFLDFLEPRITEIHRVLKDTGTFYLHLGVDEVHYAKILCDYIFGRENFNNEIIWCYDYGGRSKQTWYKKHDVILMYTKTSDYYFDMEYCDTIPYISDMMVSEDKVARGKFPTNAMFISIEGTNSKYRMGYATEKPYRLLERLIKVSCKEGDLVLDCFAGSGKFGLVAKDFNRNFILIDQNEESINIMKTKTFENYTNIEWIK